MSTAIMFAIELFVPFLIIAPPPTRYAAAVLFVLLMALIQITGNYCFFNPLGVALSVLLLDDRLLLPALRWLCPSAPSPFFIVPAADAPNWIPVVVACLVLPPSVGTVLPLFRVGVARARP